MASTPAMRTALEPLRALRYNPEFVELGEVVAPPYDVISPADRDAYIRKSAHSIVRLLLPEAPSQAARLLQEWRREGALLRDTQSSIWWHTQTYVAPDGEEGVRSGFLAAIRLAAYDEGRIRAHERTHTKTREGRLELMRAVHANLSPVFGLYDDPDGAPREALAAHITGPPEMETTDADATVHRFWQVTDEAAITAVQEAMADRTIVIADGHHRYETARTYAEEVGGEGDHSYVLMYLVSLLDPGLEIFATHRLVKGVDAAGRERLEQMLERNFRARRVEPAELAPPPVANGSLPVYGFIDRENGRALRLELASADPAERALASHEATYRQLDTAVLEKLVLEQALGMSEDDISHQRGLGYTQSTEEALSLVESGEYELAFLLRPTPVEQVKAIAEAGETMPPKSTYFYPKVPSGLIFNPLD
jgi:uncharacterized protein (DUF1015 family)